MAEAAEAIDPVFPDTPQFVSERLSRRLGLSVVHTGESVHTIRSFGRAAADYLLQRLDPQPADRALRREIPGQGMAHAARKRKCAHAFASSPPWLKVARMRALGVNFIL